jgi:hypothetical protein
MFHPVDSLAVVTIPPTPMTPMWDATGVYGSSSVVVGGQLSKVPILQSPLVSNVWFQILILIVLGLYCLMIYYYAGQVRLCLKGVFTLNAEDRFTAEHGHLYNRFIAIALMLCTLTIGIALTKAIAVWTDPVAIAEFPQWALPLTSIVIWAVAVAVMTLEWILLKTAGSFTFSGKLTGTITEIKNSHLAAAAVVITPAILLWSGVNPAWDSIMVWVVVVSGGVLLVSFTFRTFLLFVGQKVSLLVWILYLCAVEIFPIALMCTLVVKNF